jgi:hypothetical protein
MDYLTWTFFFRRLLKNPTYYGLPSLEAHDINMFLSSLIEKTVMELSNAGCVIVTDVGVFNLPALELFSNQIITFRMEKASCLLPSAELPPSTTSRTKQSACLIRNST